MEFRCASRGDDEEFGGVEGDGAGDFEAETAFCGAGYENCGVLDGVGVSCGEGERRTGFAFDLGGEGLRCLVGGCGEGEFWHFDCAPVGNSSSCQSGVLLLYYCLSWIHLHSLYIHSASSCCYFGHYAASDEF